MLFGCQFTAQLTGCHASSLKWITRVSSWPEDIILAFWECGRHPIAHTGTRSFFHSSVAKDSSGQSKRMYIILSIDEPDVYQQGSDYIALPISQKGDVFRPNSKMPGQQVLFFYKPIPNLIWALFSDIKKDIKLSSYQNMLSYQRIYRAIPFIQDEGEIGRINNYLEIYPRLKV
jgi:hypothetical protein